MYPLAEFQSLRDFGRVIGRNTSYRFSFVHHPGNHLSEAYLELSTRACTTRRNGLLREGRWNWKAVFLYLKKVEALQEAVAGLCYMSGGQLPRVS
jgi:hypothetical protein